MSVREFLLRALLATAFFSMTLTACTQMPTEKQSVTDLLPGLSFRVPNEGWRGARVIVDGLDMGAVGSYLEGAAILRILSGSHIIQVVSDGRPLVEEKIYIGDGVNRTIPVN